jgi:hypothetical protein
MLQFIARTFEMLCLRVDVYKKSQTEVYIIIPGVNLVYIKNDYWKADKIIVC